MRRMCNSFGFIAVPSTIFSQEALLCPALISYRHLDTTEGAELKQARIEDF